MKKKIIYSVLAATIFMSGIGVSHLRANVKPGTLMKAAFAGEGQVGFIHLLMDISDLNITPDQKVAIRAVLKKHWGEAKPLLKNVHASQKELRDILKTTPYDEERIRGAVYKRSEVAADLAVIRGKVTAEVQAILTPEQKEKIEAIFQRVDQRLESAPDRVEEFLNRE